MLKTSRILRRVLGQRTDSKPTLGLMKLCRTYEWLRYNFQRETLIVISKQFRHLRTDELPAGYVSGITFTSVCIDTAIYLPWLKSQCLANGVTFRRTTISHITDAARPTITSALSSETTVDVVVNCTGLSARSLGGVMDTDVIPARGQIVLVRNISDKMRFSTGTEDGVEEVCYMMTRPAGES